MRSRRVHSLSSQGPMTEPGRKRAPTISSSVDAEPDDDRIWSKHAAALPSSWIVAAAGGDVRTDVSSDDEAADDIDDFESWMASVR